MHIGENETASWPVNEAHSSAEKMSECAKEKVTKTVNKFDYFMFISNNMVYVGSQPASEKERVRVRERAMNECEKYKMNWSWLTRERPAQKTATANHIYSSISYFRLNLIIRCGVRVRFIFVILFGFPFFPRCYCRRHRHRLLVLRCFCNLAHFLCLVTSSHCFNYCFRFVDLSDTEGKKRQHFNINK